MRVLNELTEKKKVKKMPRLRRANQARDYLRFANFEPNHRRKVKANLSVSKQDNF